MPRYSSSVQALDAMGLALIQLDNLDFGDLTRSRGELFDLFSQQMDIVERTYLYLRGESRSATLQHENEVPKIEECS
jgi:hypothetical protein